MWKTSDPGSDPPVGRRPLIPPLLRAVPPGSHFRRRSRATALLVLLLALTPGCAPPATETDPARPGPPRRVGERVLFTFEAPQAGSVALAGTFNGWVPSALHLERGAGGLWRVEVELPRGRHPYKFVVDGVRWVVDPANPQRTSDGAGGEASLLVLD